MCGGFLFKKYTYICIRKKKHRQKDLMLHRRKYNTSLPNSGAMLYEQKIPNGSTGLAQATTVRAADKFGKKRRTGRRDRRGTGARGMSKWVAATVDRGTRREKITVPLSHPLILLRAQAPRADCIPAYAMGHTMRLDKIMIWISIHLHSLPRGVPLSLSLSFSFPLSTLSVSLLLFVGHRPPRLFFRHSTFRRVTLVIIRMLCSCADGARFVAVEMRRGRTDGLPPSEAADRW